MSDSIQGIISKWLYQAPTLQIFLLKSSEGQEFKILDFDLLLEGARTGDFCALTASRATDEPKVGGAFFKNRLAGETWKIVDLKEFNRPFTGQQLYDLMIETKGVGRKALDRITDGINLTELAKLVQSENWDLLKQKLLDSQVPLESLMRLIRQFQVFRKESRNFNYIVITNVLLKYKKCQLDEQKWKKCRKLVCQMIQAGHDQKHLVELIRIDPYQFILEDYIKATRRNFEIVDSIAQHGPYQQEFQRWTLETKSRQLAGIWSILLTNLYDNQDCYLPLETLLSKSRQLLGRIVPKIETQLTKVTMYKIQGGDQSKTIVFPTFIDSWEKFIVDRLAGYQFSRQHDLTEEQVQEVDPQLDPEQIKVIHRLVGDGCGVITGPPGVGKTRLIAALTRLLELKGEKLILSAPTGLACKNIARNVPDVSVYTVAKLLYRCESSEHNGGGSDSDEVDDQMDPVPTGKSAPESEGDESEKECLLQTLLKDHHGIIVDETSMLDINQFYHLLNYLPNRNFRIILVGDPNQLPSIGPGQILADLLKSKLIPSYQLTVNYRQKEGSQIIANAMKIVAGETDLKPGPDFKAVETANEQETVDLLTQLISHLKEKGELDSTIILSPFSKKGFLCSNNLNKTVKGFFNPNPSQSWGIYSVGDRVMQTKNDYKKQIVNGDIGEIIELKFKGGGSILKHLTVEFATSNNLKTRIQYTPNQAREQLTLAYVISIHKSQGNGYPSVLLLIPHHYQSSFFNRNMLYTAVTRAKQMLYMIGGDCHGAIKSPLKDRKTRLCSRLMKVKRALNQGSECLICQQLRFEQTVLPCQHQFCRSCLEEWFKKSTCCPVCREAI
jgi:hypothetical protein